MEDELAMDEPRFMKDVIYENRKKKQLTQEQLAELLNVSNKTISKWERGLSYPDITIVPMLAKVLDISLNELFDAKDAIPKNDETKDEEVYNVEVITRYRGKIVISTIILVSAIAVAICFGVVSNRLLFYIGIALGILLFLVSVMFALFSSVTMYNFFCDKLHKERYVIVFKNNLFAYALIVYVISFSIISIIFYYEKTLVIISFISYLVFAALPILILSKMKVCLCNKINILLWIISIIIFVIGLIGIIYIDILPYILLFVFSQIINYTIIFLSNDIKK